MEDKLANHDESVRLRVKFNEKGIPGNVFTLIHRFALRYGEDAISVEFCHSLFSFISSKLLEGQTDEVKKFIIIKLLPGDCDYFYSCQVGYHRINVEVLVSNFVSFRCEVIWEVMEFHKCDPGISDGNWQFEFSQFELNSYQEFLPKIVDQVIRLRERKAAEFLEEDLFEKEYERIVSEWRISKFESEWVYWFIRKFGKDQVSKDFFRILRDEIKLKLISQFCGGKSLEYKKYIQRQLQMVRPDVKDIFPLPLYPEKLAIPFKISPYGAYVVQVDLMISSYTKDKMDLVILENEEKELFVEISKIETAKMDGLFEEWDTYWRHGKIPGIDDLLKPNSESN